MLCAQAPTSRKLCSHVEAAGQLGLSSLPRLMTTEQRSQVVRLRSPQQGPRRPKCQVEASVQRAIVHLSARLCRRALGHQQLPLQKREGGVPV